MFPGVKELCAIIEFVEEHRRSLSGEERNALIDLVQEYSRVILNETIEVALPVSRSL